jgi:hypothetical protein
VLRKGHSLPGEGGPGGLDLLERPHRLLELRRFWHKEAMYDGILPGTGACSIVARVDAQDVMGPAQSVVDYSAAIS